LDIRVTNDELAALKLGQCDKPDPERVKHMLLSAARSNVRNVFARIDEARNEKFKAEAKLHAGKSKRVPKANGIIKWDNHPVEG